MKYSWLSIVLLLVGFTVVAQPVTVTDVLGRKVTLKAPAKKVLLGEGRDIVTLNLLHPRPGDLVAVWQGDFKKTDEYKKYAAKFPELEKIPISGTNAASFSAEIAIVAKPDVAIFAVKGHGPGPDAKELIKQLEAAKIPVVFIDFRIDPFKNTVPSIRVLGQVLNLQTKANAFIDFYETRLNNISKVIAANNPAKPKVVMDMRPGTSVVEFNSPGKGNLNQFIALAGGDNIGAAALPGPVGQLNPEFVISQKPQIYIATGMDVSKGGKGVTLGAGISKTEAEQSLKARINQSIIAGLPAVKNKRVYAFWHTFYASPFNVLAAECMAKWIHPGLFKDVNPDASLKILNEQFLSVPMSGTYWISLDK